MEKEAAMAEQPLRIKSHLLSALVNVAAIMLAYVLVTAGYLWYLKTFVDIDLMGMLISSFLEVKVELLGTVAGFLEHLAEDYLQDTIIFAALYAMYITNNRLEMVGDHLHYQRGLFLLDKTHILLQDIEEVYVKPYPFFQKTKALRIISLDEGMIKMPYVADADEVKRCIIAAVRTAKRRQGLTR